MVAMYKAFIVDDEQMIVKGLSKLIPWNELGYELVATAFNGKTALKLIADLQPHLVVSDIQLGDTTGLELIDAAKKINPDLIFIFISGYDDFSYCQKAISKGAVDYLLKPVDIAYLSSVLTKCKEKLKDIQILQTTDRISFNSHNLPLNETPEDEKLIDSIKSFIDTNYNENIDIPTISAKFYIGQTYFSELFKKEFGINFKKYLTEVRIEKAKLYIMDNNYKISDIAMRVGYDDPGYFSQVFKKQTGLTPRAFKVKFNIEGDHS